MATTVLNSINYHGYVVYQDGSKGFAPYLLNEIMKRIGKKLATNIVVVGEAGIGKSYLAMDLCRMIMGLDKKGEDRFKLDQVVFRHKTYMDLILNLPMGYPIVFDEPSYSLSKRTWFQEVQRALVMTIESQRFKVHPLIISIINSNLLDKTIREHLITFKVIVHDRGKADVYRVRSSQFSDKLYHKWFCKLDYGLFDKDKCPRDSCLDCDKLMSCNLFRARYERKKATIQDQRYSQAYELADKTEARALSMEQLEKLCLTLKGSWIKKGKMNVQLLRLSLQDEYGIRISNAKAYDLRAMLMKHHQEILSIVEE